MNEKKLPLWEHIEEIRQRIIYVLIAWGILFFCILPFSPTIIHYISYYTGPLVFLAPQEALIVRLKIAGACAMVITFPFFILQVWRFISPGLTPEERKAIIPLALGSLFLFYTGLGAGFFLLFPPAIKFLLSMQTPSLQPMIRASYYLNLAVGFGLIVGILFQIPIALLILAKLGIVDTKKLVAQWRVAILTLTIVGAIITPTVDIVNLLLFLIPGILLYFLSIALIALSSKEP